MRVAVAICTHCWFKYLNVSCRLKLMMVEWLFLAMPRGCLRFVIVVFPDHTHLLFFSIKADSFPDASKLYGKKAKVCEFFQDISVVHMVNQVLY